MRGMGNMNALTLLGIEVSGAHGLDPNSQVACSRRNAGSPGTCWRGNRPVNISI
jgi:hypothetical protein